MVHSCEIKALVVCEAAVDSHDSFLLCLYDYVFVSVAGRDE